MRKIFHKIHVWLSVPFGLIIVAICLSGAALVFEKEVMEGCYPERYYVQKVEGSAIPVDQLLTLVARTLPDSVSVTGVTIASEPDRAYQVTLSKPRRASLYINPYTGEIQGKYERAPFFSFMFKMHRWLLDSMKPGDTVYVGKLVVGISTLMFVFVLISGLVIWIPRTRKALKNRLSITVNKGYRRFWYDLHVAGGLYATLFLLAMALTGLTWSFPWYRTAFYTLFGVETKPQQQKDGRSSEKLADRGSTKRGKETFVHWQNVYDQLCVLNPGYKQINLSHGSASVSFPRLGNQRASDSYTFNSEGGEITQTTLYDHQEKSGKIRGWIYSVHVGSWGGTCTRMLSFLAALLGGILPLTGYYFWIKRWRRTKLRASK